MRKMFKSRLAKLGLAMVIAVGAAVYWFWPPTASVESAEIRKGIQVKFKANGSQIEEYSNQSWKPYFAKGVNMGATIPGHFPGELAISTDDYERWFEMIQQMGANVIRVYTILKPEFYETLVRYNAKHQDHPLFFIQGVWSPEEELIAGKDAFDPKLKEKFAKEIEDAVEAVYGNATIQSEAHSGKASGKYVFNAGPYLMGWIVGTEWDPVMVRETNKKHPDAADYKGAYFQSKPGANPFEKWVAEMVDRTAKTEAKHGWQHPIAFSNWVTTDPIEHPGEPLVAEDMVSVDPTHIEPVNWDAGYFASYHVYPYYPDFFTYDKSFQTMKNKKGQIDSYQTYLHKLKEYHRDIPIMITEFGVPASQGIAHMGMLGRNQGGHDEKEQGEMDADMFRQIHEEGYSGAILFTWQDEWFKKTWNTLNYDIPDRRAYWYNTLTNESFFGVLGMFPSKDEKLRIDGDTSDWDKLGTDEKAKIDTNSKGLNELWVSHDEGYLYLMAKLSEPFDPSKQAIYFGMDTLQGGNRHAPQLQGKTLDEGLETLLELSDEQKGKMMIASNYDFHTRAFGKTADPALDSKQLQDDSGIFKPWKLVVNYLLERPDSRVSHPFKDVEVGDLLRGNNDPSQPDYNSKAMWQAKGNILEVRIPWMLLGFSDPSSLRVINYEKTDRRQFKTTPVEGIRIVPWIVKKDTKEVIGFDGNPPYPVSKLPLYTWKSWKDTDVQYVERPKQSYYIMQKAMHEVDQPVKK
ncbi:hypothetical protein NDK47_19800 [Brevibacillus ruminantium]|uniref:Family 2 glycosyl transferase n=1 Tax=Brevibacillus ruminantium TaxID=2950604 RepID=A0ABY4WB33_9BACL|nr:hypothetical protein [Brevibacillus ruminantium]USG64380.1 hypothetical protein NDK47_19800 [Brevibacillus ruminantium]